MIYTPSTNMTCVYLYDKDTLRVYETTPNYNSDVSYTDYFVNSHYLYREGTQHFSSYSTLPTCLDSSVLTNDFYYRNDFDSIMIIFFIMFIFMIYYPYKIISRIGGKYFRV